MRLGNEFTFSKRSTVASPVVAPLKTAAALRFQPAGFSLHIRRRDLLACLIWEGPIPRTLISPFTKYQFIETRLLLRIRIATFFGQRIPAIFPAGSDPLSETFVMQSFRVSATAPAGRRTRPAAMAKCQLFALELVLSQVYSTAWIQKPTLAPRKYCRPMGSKSCTLVLASPPARNPKTGGCLSNTLLIPAKISISSPRR